MVDQTIDARFIDDLPCRMIGDKAYDSDPLDERLLRKYGIEMISPNRADGHGKPRMDDPCDATEDAGKSNDSSPGSHHSAESSSDTSPKSKTIPASSTLLASKYYYDVFRYAQGG